MGPGWRAQGSRLGGPRSRLEGPLYVVPPKVGPGWGLRVGPGLGPRTQGRSRLGAQGFLEHQGLLSISTLLDLLIRSDQS